MSRQLQTTLLLGGTVLLLGGCAGGDPGRQPVSGTVTLAGRPLAQGHIEFFATGGPPGPAGGARIQDGAFTLPAEFGLPPGVYRVEIRSPVLAREAKPDGMSSPPTREQVPARYNRDSQLTAEVRAGRPNQLHFALEP